MPGVEKIQSVLAGNRDQRRWQKILSAFGRLRVGIIGDLMVDENIWGSVDRISQEAPVPVVKVTGESRTLGGAANVAANVASLGGTVVLLGVLGGDAAGNFLREECARRGISMEGVHTDSRRPTTLKTRLIARHQHVARFDRETSTKIENCLADALLAHVRANTQRLDAVIVSDYDKGVISPGLMNEISKCCRELSVPLFLDCKSRKFSSSTWVTAITPNEHELAALTATVVQDTMSLLEACRRLFEALGTSYVLTTRGEAGMLLCDRSGKAWEVPALAREVYDVTGAGDTVIATLAMAYASGAEALEAVFLASAAAGQVVSKVGTATTTEAEIIAALRDYPWRPQRRGRRAGRPAPSVAILTPRI